MTQSFCEPQTALAATSGKREPPESVTSLVVHRRKEEQWRNWALSRVHSESG